MNCQERSGKMTLTYGRRLPMSINLSVKTQIKESWKSKVWKAKSKPYLRNIWNILKYTSVKDVFLNVFTLTSLSATIVHRISHNNLHQQLQHKAFHVDKMSFIIVNLLNPSFVIQHRVTCSHHQSCNFCHEISHNDRHLVFRSLNFYIHPTNNRAQHSSITCYIRQ